MSLLDVSVTRAQLDEELGALGTSESAVSLHNHIAIASAGLVVDTRRLLLRHRLHDRL